MSTPVRILRTIEYVGPQSRIEEILARSIGTEGKCYDGQVTIREVHRSPTQAVEEGAR